MATDPIFIDFLSSRISGQARNLKEAIEFVIRETASDSDDFTANYNGYWLLIEKVYEQALADQDVEAQRYARFAQSLILLSTGVASDITFSADEMTALAQQVSPELLRRHTKMLDWQASRPKLGVAYYPRIHALFNDLEGSLEHFIFGPHYAPVFRVEQDTRIITVGSCFAINIANFLTAFGFQVSNFGAPEEASPATFPSTVDAMLNGDDPSTRELIRNSPSLCVIFTAGVGEMLRMQDGTQVAASAIKSNPARMRSIESVGVFPPDEIAASIEAGFAMIRTLNPRATLVCTVSPVPLDASFDNSAGIMVRNAYSKAALMLGVQQACAGDERISYFPSYEIVKEWAPLAGVQAFAANDGHPRHVSRNLVLIICLMFLKHFVGESDYRRVLKEKTGSDDLSLLRKTIVQ